MIIKAIPTRYKGILFRSKLEAQWAKFFDKLNIKWIYEPEGIEFDDGTKYLPDFYLPELECFFEVKGIMSDFDRNKVEKLAYSGLCKQVVVGYADGKIELYENEGAIYNSHNRDDYRYGDSETGIVLSTDLADVAYCLHCNKITFLNNAGWWQCRNCGKPLGKYYLDSRIGLRDGKFADFQELSQIDVRNKEC